MESLSTTIKERLELVKHFADKCYCVCPKCGKEKPTKLVNGVKTYDLYAECRCGSTKYELRELSDNREYVLKILKGDNNRNNGLIDAYKTEIHDYLVPSELPDKETQIRAHIKDIYTTILPFLERQLKKLLPEAVKEQYAALYDDFTALVAFRHFETFCMYVDSVFGSKHPFIGSRHLFQGFYYFANSMVLNKDVHFIEKQCFAGAGKSVTDCALMAFILGYDINSVIVKVFGNQKNIRRGVETLLKIMTSAQYAKVFPYYARFGRKEHNIFSVDAPANGELTVSGSYQPTSVLMVTKNEDFDGVRAQYLFLDDITQSKDKENKEMHQKDIDKFNSSWFERKDDLDDTFIIASGTTYHQEDFLSWLKGVFGVEYAKETKFRFTSISNKNELGLPWLSVFCVIYGLDENDKSTFEERFPTEVFLFKRAKDYRNFMAMVQQIPQPPEGSPFDYDNLPNTYGTEGIPHLPDRTQEFCTASLDPARIGLKDFHSMPIIVEIDGRRYLQDCIFERCAPDKLPEKVVAMIEKHRIVHLDIENNTDTTFDVLIKKLLAERGITTCLVTNFFSYNKKDAKIGGNETGIKSIYFPRKGVYSPNSQMGQFMYWLTAYNFDKPPKHDDSVDSLANYAMRFIMNKPRGAKVKVLSRRNY